MAPDNNDGRPDGGLVIGRIRGWSSSTAYDGPPRQRWTNCGRKAAGWHNLPSVTRSRKISKYVYVLRRCRTSSPFDRRTFPYVSEVEHESNIFIVGTNMAHWSDLFSSKLAFQLIGSQTRPVMNTRCVQFSNTTIGSRFGNKKNTRKRL